MTCPPALSLRFLIFCKFNCPILDRIPTEGLQGATVDFKDKLGILIRVSGIKGKELSRRTGIPESTISLYKTGKRAHPRKTGNLDALASCFASVLRDDATRRALANFSEGELVVTSEDEVVAASQILAWLKGESPVPHATLDMIERGAYLAAMPQAQFSPALLDEQTLMYYGDQGKKQALRDVLSHLLAIEEPGTVYLSVDEDALWLFDDADFLNMVLGAFGRLVERGFEAYHILPPTNVSRYFDFVSESIPLYTSGRVTPLYYPRFRDNVFRGFLLAMEGKVSLMSIGVADAGGTPCIVDVGGSLTSSVTDMIKSYAAMCLPAVELYSGKAAYERFDALMRDGISHKSLSMRNVLPTEITPTENLEEVLAVSKDPMVRERAMSLLEGFRGYDGAKGLDGIVMSRVCSPSQVVRGEVPLLISGVPAERCPAHSPETYARHLRAVLDWMAMGDSHHFIPLNATMSTDQSLVVQKGKRAVLARYGNTFELFEAMEPSFVRLCEERVLLVLDHAGYSASLGKMQVESQIRELVSQLERIG